MKSAITSIIEMVSRLFAPDTAACRRFSFPGFSVTSSSAQQSVSFRHVLKDRVRTDFNSLAGHFPVNRIIRRISGVSGVSTLPASSGEMTARGSQTHYSGATVSGKTTRKETGSDAHYTHTTHGSFFCDGCDLAGQSVLCVGGRARLYREYRQLVKAYGGDLVICRSSRTEADAREGDNTESHPAGGHLDALLDRADMVVCPIDCIDHNDYFAVRHYCKRTGKPCAFLRRSCLPSFCKGVEILAGCVSRLGMAAPCAGDNDSDVTVSGYCKG